MKNALMWIFILAILGIADSIHLLEIFHGQDVFMCNWNSKIDCTAVNTSKYASIGGFPVAAVGLIGYSILAFMSGLLICKKKYGLINSRNLFLLASFGLLFQLYLTGIEIFVLGKYCLFCITSQIIILTIVILCYKNWKSK